MRDSLAKSFICCFSPKEKWGVFFAKGQKPSLRANRGTERIKVFLKLRFGWLPGGYRVKRTKLEAHGNKLRYSIEIPLDQAHRTNAESIALRI